MDVLTDLVAEVRRMRPESVATPDMDATLIETMKAAALYSYKKSRSYQPLNLWWFEQRLLVHSEFRDGNVPAGFEQLRVFKEAPRRLPAGVEKVRLRTNTAGYEHELLQYCEQGKNERFGRIEFAVGCDVTPAFKAAVALAPEEEWKPIRDEVDGLKIKTGREWAEVVFVPNKMCNTKKGTYRFLAIREPLARPCLPGMEKQLPFPTMFFDNRACKLFGMVSNMDWEGETLIH